MKMQYKQFFFLCGFTRFFLVFLLSLDNSICSHLRVQIEIQYTVMWWMKGFHSFYKCKPSSPRVYHYVHCSITCLNLILSLLVELTPNSFEPTVSSFVHKLPLIWHWNLTIFIVNLKTCLIFLHHYSSGLSLKYSTVFYNIKRSSNLPLPKLSEWLSDVLTGVLSPLETLRGWWESAAGL